MCDIRISFHRSSLSSLAFWTTTTTAHLRIEESKKTIQIHWCEYFLFILAMMDTKETWKNFNFFSWKKTGNVFLGVSLSYIIYERIIFFERFESFESSSSFNMTLLDTFPFRFFGHPRKSSTFFVIFESKKAKQKLFFTDLFPLFSVSIYLNHGDIFAFVCPLYLFLFFSCLDKIKFVAITINIRFRFLFVISMCV